MQINLRRLRCIALQSKQHRSLQCVFLSQSSKSTPRFILPEGEWAAKLTPEQFRVLRGKATELPFRGKYENHGTKGIYTCAGCSTPLYSSAQKFDSGCGWPAFYDALPGAIEAIPDEDGARMEIVCAHCHGHMGHVFKGEGYPTPTDERHCVNSISLHFQPHT